MVFDRHIMQLAYVATFFLVAPIVLLGVARYSAENAAAVAMTLLAFTVISFLTRKNTNKPFFLPRTPTFLFLTAIAFVGVQKNPENQRLAAAEKAEAAAQAAAEAERIANYRAPIHPSALSAYTPSEYPKLFAAWGRNGVSRIEALRQAAAEKVSREIACDGIEAVDIADNRSRPPVSPVVYVDCTNRQRFMLSEADLSGPVLSQEARAKEFGSTKVQMACQERVRAQLHFPSSMDVSWFGNSSRVAETTGNWVVEFDFEAKNGLGLTLPYRGRCVMTPEGVMDDATISER